MHSKFAYDRHTNYTKWAKVVIYARAYMDHELNHLGRQLKSQLASATKPTATDKRQKINVAGVGGVVSLAYEQLRKAAEYTQEHLLRQRAIRRFYARNISFFSKSDVDKSIAEELIVELTQAGYLENDSQDYEILEKIFSSAHKHHQNYWRMRDAGADRGKTEEWTLDLLSVETEDMLADERKQDAYLYFAYNHYMGSLDREKFGSKTNGNYEASLYIAIHRALLKSDLATIRHDMLQLYKISDHNIQEYIVFQQKISEMHSSDLTDKLTRYINKHGAPLRILKSMIQDNPMLPSLMADDKRFINAFETQVAAEYRTARQRLNQGLVKSIVFLLITKSIVGLLIEIPYDIAVTGAIVIMPLVINLLFPVVYLMILRLGLKIPGKPNTNALVAYIQDALYSDKQRPTLRAKTKKSRYSVGFTVVYGIMFIAAFSLVVSQLINLDFNIAQGAIFFLFLATASFLGFRLSHIIRELELVTAKPGFIQMIRDFLYLPFIILGQWLSDKYQKLNIVALILDTVIELPLKTVLRLIRQWASFINDKKDQI